MNVFVFRLIFAMVAIATAGCANVHFRTFADNCNGIGGSLTVGLFGEGQSVQQCVRNGQIVGIEGQGFRRPPPGQAALAIMQSTEPLAQWASGNGKAPVLRYENCNVNESGQWVGYNCAAGHSSSSLTIDGQVVQQGGPPMGGGFQPQSFGGGTFGGGTIVGPTGQEWRAVRPGRIVQPGSPYSYGGPTNPYGPRIAVQRRIGGVGGGAPYHVY